MQADLSEFARNPSHDAFKAIVLAHGPAVRAHALARLHDAHAADDVTQAVFIMLSRKAPHLSPRTVLSGYLHGATRLACKAYLRAAARRRKHERAAAEHRPEHTAALPPPIEAREVVDEAMALIARSDRDALLLRYQDGLSVPEVASRLGLSHEAAKKRLTRAATRLREALTRLGLGGGTFSISGGETPWLSEALRAPALDDTLSNQILSNFHTPAGTTAGAVLIVKGVSAMVRRNLILAVAAGSLALVAVTGTAIALRPAFPPTPPSPTALPAVARVPAPAPATRRLDTPANAFQRLAESIGSGDEAAAIDCFVTPGDAKENAVISLARLSAAEARMEKQWKQTFPATPHPSGLGQRMDQVLKPMVPLLVMIGPQMMPPQGDEVILRLRDSGIPIPPNSHASQWMDVGIRLERGNDGLWRFDVATMMALAVEREENPMPGTPDSADLAALNKRLFDDLVAAADSFAADLKAGEFNDAALASDDYLQRFTTAMKVNGIRAFNFVPVLPR